MPPPTDARLFTLLGLVPSVLAAQRQALELRVGRWDNGSGAMSYEFRTRTPLAGPFTHGFAATVLVNDNLGRRRAFYGAGYEIQWFRGTSALVPYALLGAALGLSTDTATQEVGILWNVGGGVAWRPFAGFALEAETRYRVEDRGPRGFWRAGTDARRGIGVALGISIGSARRKRTAASGGGGGGGGGVGGGEGTAPVAQPPTTFSGNAGDVVETALDVLGTPYTWGGTADNGFDCSGLIQYAYGEHGLRLPRRSRDQAGVGAEVAPVVEALRPADILLFSARPGAGVTHVGMYVGDGKFIHSATDGVKLSRLDPHDPDGAYWIAHWVGVRRVIP